MDLINDKKILVITVGTGKDGKDISHGINFSIEQQNPDVIYLLMTETSKQQTFPYLKLHGKEIYEHTMSNPDDVELLTDEISRVISDDLRRHPKNKISADYTSGTKAMSAALVAVAIKFELNSICYVTGQRQDGRVVSGSERLSIIKPNKLLNDSKIELYKEFFNKRQFYSAIEVLENIGEIHPDNMILIDFYKLLASAFDRWDKFNFGESFSIFDKLSHEHEDLLRNYGLKSKIEQYKTVLHKLNQNALTTYHLYDIVANAKRRADEGKFDDSVARLYRAMEMAAQIDFIETFKCETSNADINSLPAEIQKDYHNKYHDEKDDKIKLPLYAVYYALFIKGNKIGILFQKNMKLLQKLLGIRNNSILAHGSNPVSKEVFDELFSFISEQFLESKKLTEFPALR